MSHLTLTTFNRNYFSIGVITLVSLLFCIYYTHFELLEILFVCIPGFSIVSLML